MPSSSAPDCRLTANIFKIAFHFILVRQIYFVINTHFLNISFHFLITVWEGNLWTHGSRSWPLRISYRFGLQLQILQCFHNFCSSLYSQLTRGHVCNISEFLLQHKVRQIATLLSRPPLVSVALFKIKDKTAVARFFVLSRYSQEGTEQTKKILRQNGALEVGRSSSQTDIQRLSATPTAIL